MNSSDEINLHQLLQVFTRRWKYLLLLGLLSILGALVKHKYFPIYPGVGKLIIKDVRNSQLQSTIGHVVGMDSEIISSDLKGEDLVIRSEALLDIHDFYVSVAKRLIAKSYDYNNLGLRKFLDGFKGKRSDPEFVHDVANKIASYISFNSNKADVLSIEVKTSYKDLTVLLVNETLMEAKNNLINRELEDLNQAENYFTQELSQVRGRIESIEDLKIKKLKNRQILSVDDEKGESFKYINELKRNIYDSEIVLANNTNKINEISAKFKKSSPINTSISKFNESSQIRQLNYQNETLGLDLKTHLNYLKNFENQNSGLVSFQYEIEKMNAAHDFEYKMYSSLNDSISRIGLQKTYVKNKIEILELERSSRVRSSPPLMILLTISLTISQVMGLFGIYLLEMFKPSSVKS